MSGFSFAYTIVKAYQNNNSNNKHLNQFNPTKTHVETV